MSDLSVTDPKVASTSDSVARPTCSISGKPFPARSLQSLGSLRPSLTEQIMRDHPKLTHQALISTVELDKYRMKYVEDMLLAEHGELTALDRENDPLHFRPARRSFLQIGGLARGGLALPQLLQAENVAGTTAKHSSRSSHVRSFRSRRRNWVSSEIGSKKTWCFT